VVFAYGGAVPWHAGVYARELGAQGVVVPLGEILLALVALGAASADLLHIYEAVDIQSSPFDPARVMSHFTELEAQGLASARGRWHRHEAGRLARSADIRYKGQINEVEVPVPPGPLDRRGARDVGRRLPSALRDRVRQGRPGSSRRAWRSSRTRARVGGQRQAAHRRRARDDREPAQEAARGDAARLLGRARRLRSDPCVLGPSPGGR